MAVYVFGEPGALLVKVGYTGAIAGPREREMALKRFWRGGEMLYLSSGYVTRTTERRAQDILRSRFWLEGEWFVCGVDVAKAAVRRAIRRQRESMRAARRAFRARRPA